MSELIEPSPEPGQQTHATIINGHIPTIYIEGVSQMMIGFPNSRLSMFDFVERDAKNPNHEVRNIACTLVLPTTSLIELTQVILGSLASNKAVLDNAQSEWVDKLNTLMASLNPARAGQASAGTTSR